MVLKVKARQSKESVITGRVRTSFANLFTPKSINGSAPKYSTVVLIDKNDADTLTAIEQAKQYVYEQEVDGALVGASYKDVYFTMKDGDTDAPEGNEEVYAGHYFMTVKSSTQPGIVSHEKGADGKFVRLTNPNDLQSGDYISANIGLYAYNYNGNVGISAGLNNVMKLEKGKRLGVKRTTAEDAFGSFNDEDNNDLF